MKITYSIVAPIFNEKENLSELHRRVSEVMDSLGEPWELILVDDGSTDSSADMIRALAKQDKRVRPVIFARNFGHRVNVVHQWVGITHEQFLPGLQAEDVRRVFATDLIEQHRLGRNGKSFSD